MKICIVGGGSAGWMTASTLVKCFPEWDITLVESDKVQPTGVGESTTQLFRNWLHLLELEDEEWMSSCDATYKLSVRFHNFHAIGDTPWQYPFGVPREDDIGHPEYFFYNKYLQGWDNNKFAEDYWLTAYCAANNLIPYGNPHFRLRQSSGFHFDAVKFANWLRDNYALPRGVKRVIGHVDEFDGERVFIGDTFIPADLFFDCTGFKSLLNDSEWVDYSDHLPNDRAWVTRIPYKDRDTEMVPVTDCTALSSGWVWNVPTWERIGTGYNFSSKYQSEEDALKEFVEYLDTDENQSFRLIKYNTGRKKEIWNKNVISIGLSAGFIEPLESNGLLSVHQFLVNFVRVMLNADRGVVTQYMRDNFNWISNNGFDVFRSFVNLHYALTQRDDSPYWKAVGNIRYPDDGPGGPTTWLKDCITASPESFNENFHFKFEGMLCVMAGHGWNPFNAATYNNIQLYGGLDPAHPANPDKFCVPSWDLDNCEHTHSYYKRTIYAD